VNQIEEFLKLVRGRRSIRKFRRDPLPKEVLRCIIEAASWAPSASNRQDWEFRVVTSSPVKERMRNIVRSRWESVLDRSSSDVIREELQKYISMFDWFSHAPALIIISAKRPESFLYHILGDTAGDVAGTEISAAMAAQNLMLAAHASGIGSCCVTGPLAAQEELKGLLEIGKGRKIVCLIALGYPAEQPEAPLRKSVERVSKYIE
jgi:coenzyme F420-0:L-glutamate ligase/coenzyme F420-1:gamma-L-glutamate ligase